VPGQLSNSIRRAVRKRAGGICEYCHTSEKWQYVLFTIDHIYPPHLGGTNDLDNLALACFHCNRQKSGQVNAADPVSGEVARYFTRDNRLGPCISSGRLISKQ
jgi:5-methylcytosine-specific restriction endonuclease McrA